jgi:hypothetical protein
MCGVLSPYDLIVPAVFPAPGLFYFDALAGCREYARIMPPPSMDKTLVTLEEANRLRVPQLWVWERT